MPHCVNCLHNSLELDMLVWPSVLIDHYETVPSWLLVPKHCFLAVLFYFPIMSTACDTLCYHHPGPAEVGVTEILSIDGVSLISIFLLAKVNVVGC